MNLKPLDTWVSKGVGNCLKNRESLSNNIIVIKLKMGFMNKNDKSFFNQPKEKI